MSKISDFANDAVKDIVDDEKRQNEKFRIIGMLEEKKQTYISTGCSEENAELMALSEAEAIGNGIADDSTIVPKKGSELVVLRSKKIITLLKLLKYVLFAECIFFVVMMIISLVKTVDSKIVILVSYLCNLLSCIIPAASISVYNKATKDVQRIFLIVISAVFLLFATYRMFGVLFL